MLISEKSVCEYILSKELSFSYFYCFGRPLHLEIFVFQVEVNVVYEIQIFQLKIKRTSSKLLRVTINL